MSSIAFSGHEALLPPTDAVCAHAVILVAQGRPRTQAVVGANQMPVFSQGHVSLFRFTQVN